MQLVNSMKLIVLQPGGEDLRKKFEKGRAKENTSALSEKRVTLVSKEKKGRRRDQGGRRKKGEFGISRKKSNPGYCHVGEK